MVSERQETGIDVVFIPLLSSESLVGCGVVADEKILAKSYVRSSENSLDLAPPLGDY